jgi:hypothetical protein
MANITDPTPEQKSGWDAWVSERPCSVREVIQKYALAPWKLYRLKSSGHRVTLYSVDEPEDGSFPTLKVDVSGRYNMLSFERRVFGIKPDDLEECELPSGAEPLGAVLTHDEVGAAVEGVPAGEPRMQAIRDATYSALDDMKPHGEG